MSLLAFPWEPFEKPGSPSQAVVPSSRALRPLSTQDVHEYGVYASGTLLVSRPW